MLQGATAPQLLEGVHGQTVLPMLLPSLTGAFSESELIVRHPQIERRLVTEILQQLEVWNFIERLDSGDIEHEFEIAAELLFWDKYAINNGLRIKAEALLAICRSIRVEIAAPPHRRRDAQEFLSALEASQVDSTLADSHIPVDHIFVSIVWPHEESKSFKTVGIHLIVTDDAYYIAACCSDLARCCTDGYISTVRGLVKATPEAGVIAQHVIESAAFNLISLAIDFALGARCTPFCRRISTTNGMAEDIYVAPNICHDKGRPSPTSSALLYEHAVRQGFRRARVYQSSSEDVKSRFVREPFSAALKVNLPPHAPALLPVSPNARPKGKDIVSAEEIGALLSFTVGQRSAARRWCSSAGNMGSPLMYLIVHAVKGLDAGVYVYESTGHRLANIETHLHPYSNLLSAPHLGDGKRPAAEILLCGDITKLQPKYGLFAYKLMQLDSGVVLNQASLIARALGLQFNLAEPPVLDSIQDIFSLNRTEHAPTGFMQIWDGSRQRNIGRLFKRILQPTSSSDVRQTIPDLQGYNASELVLNLTQEAATASSDPPVRSLRNLLMPQARTRIRPAKRSVFLPIVSRVPEFNLTAILKERTSVRHFSGEAIAIDLLSKLLRSGTPSPSMDIWFRRANVQLWLLITDVIGLPPGIYLYNQQLQSLNLVRDTLTRDEATRAFNEPLVKGHALCLWFTASLRGATSAQHRATLQAGSAWAHNIWLAACNLRVDGCLIAGMSPDTADEFGLTGNASEISLIGLTLGYDSRRIKDGEKQSSPGDR